MTRPIITADAIARATTAVTNLVQDRVNRGKPLPSLRELAAAALVAGLPAGRTDRWAAHLVVGGGHDRRFLATRADVELLTAAWLAKHAGSVDRVEVSSPYGSTRRWHDGAWQAEMCRCGRRLEDCDACLTLREQWDREHEP